MDFAFSDEQEDFRKSLRRFLEEKSPRREVRRLMGTSEGFDPVVWKQMASELGLQGIHIPEAYGGQGFGFLELAIILEEMGRVVMGGPYFATVCLAANAILNAGSEEQRKALLPGIAAGDTLATLALVEPDTGWDPAETAAVAEHDGPDWRLSGTKSLVLDGHNAHLVVTVARLPGTSGREGLGLWLVRSDAPGFRATRLDTLDATRKQARLDLDGVPAEPLGRPGVADPALTRTLRQALTLLSAEMTGGAQRCLDMAVAYARDRVQFARPIGSFQALKHKAADVLLEVECARSAAYYAAWAASEDGEELEEAAPLAKAVCAEAYFQAAAESIQIHGGIGFTWEHDAHLYYKRARSSEALLGDATHHRASLAEHLGL